MATHKLILDDLENIDYCLYAIRTELEDYRLAHALNLTLGSRLNRKDFDLDTGSGSENLFPVFEWNNIVFDTNWSLIKNSCKVEQKNQGQGLFANSSEATIKTVNLLEEHPSVDYFLKIDGQTSPNQKIISTINKIPDISMVYSVDLDNIKSKEYLILD